jgi:CheY-like chemotaxis protein
MKPPSLSVLVADDEEDIRLLLQAWFVAGGHTVFCAASATEAIKVMGKVRFDLVVTDVLMPDGDGSELITHLRRTQPDARILAISGGGRYMDGNDCLRMARGLGADAALMKPFGRDKLLQGVAEALAPRPPAGESAPLGS